MWTFNLSKLFNCLAGQSLRMFLFEVLIVNFTLFQNKTSAKPPALCPFCRSEIKGFESVVISPFDSAFAASNRKELSSFLSNEFDDVKKLFRINMINTCTDFIFVLVLFFSKH